MCRRHVPHRPVSSSKIACVAASDGGLTSDTGFMYPVATLRGAWPWLILLVDTNVVEDPTYLQLPFQTAIHYKLERDASTWDPTPCDARF
jgi:hypothetical protein